VATIVVLMAVVVTVAVIGPARQALRVSPLEAMRHDA
jgi:ABC-type lipoprotein release transport system permease subunit